MPGTEQLDLFSRSDGPAARCASGGKIPPVMPLDTLDDDCLLAAIPSAGLRDGVALAAEAGRRRLAAAVPVLEAVCRRFAGFGADRVVPEQTAALDALVMIGGSDAAETLVRLIVKRVVQGPCLRQAVAAAALLRARFPLGTVLELLRHGDRQVRVNACQCTRPWPEAVPLLRDLLDDLHADVRKAAACALGRMERGEVRGLLVRYLHEQPTVELIDAIASTVRYLHEQPTVELIDAIASIANEECIVLLGRIARASPDLSECALAALSSIDHPRAEKLSAALRQTRPG